jgi:predicted ArsR family transcriptional regulator
LPLLTAVQQSILAAIKRRSSATIAELAADLAVSSEAVRQHVVKLAELNLIEASPSPTTPTRSGRPPLFYRLSQQGELAFPKAYAELAVAILELAAEKLGEDGDRAIVSALADKRYEAWKEVTEGKSLEERVHAMRGLYAVNDSYCEVKKNNGTYQIIEYNCPFLQVALEKPIVCSSSVNLLERILGFRVIRRATFQRGDSRCVFEIDTSQPVSVEAFELERTLED